LFQLDSFSVDRPDRTVLVLRSQQHSAPMASAQAQRRGTHTKLKNQSTSALPRAVTPSRGRELPFEDPGTPGMDAERHGTFMEPAAPQPRRPFQILASSTPGSPDSADHATNNELRDLWDRGDGPLGDLCRSESSSRPAWYLKALGPDGEMGVDYRPLSSVSTNAPLSSGPTPCPTTPGMTPCPEAGAAPSPLCTGSSQLEEADSRRKKGTQKMQKLEEGGDRREVPSQSRKVFVGGVPQEVGQDDLYRFFNEQAPVKKAWLQKYRAASTANPSNNHRGFGFVIFMEAKAVDDLLGPSQSRFFYPPGGGKLEVKRAVSSSDMQTEEQTGKAEKPQQSILSVDSSRAAGNDAQAAPVPGQDAVRAAPWPSYQMGPAPQAIMMTSVPWHGCGGHPLVQQLPAYAHGAQFQGMVKAAPNMTISFQSDAQQMHCYGNPSMPRSSVSPTMAFAPNMQCSGPRMGGDGVPQMWMTGVPPQVPQPLPQSAQPVQLNPEVVQQMGQRISYWPQSVPAGSGVAAPGVVQQQQTASGFGRPQGHAGMLMQQPHMDAYNVCNEATAAQLRDAMPDYYED